MKLSTDEHGEFVTLKTCKGNDVFIDADCPHLHLLASRTLYESSNRRREVGGVFFPARVADCFPVRNIVVARLILDILTTGHRVQADHIDRNVFNNRRHNLRLATQSLQNANRRPFSATGYKGVYGPRHKCRKYAAQAAKDGTRYWLGLHHTAEAAARAYDSWATLHFGQFANLNFPTGSVSKVA